MPKEIKALEALKNILYWKKKADTTPELLLSSHHAKSDECGEIMRKYEESFKIAEQVIAKAEIRKRMEGL